MKYYYTLLRRFFALHATDKKLMRNLIITAILRTVTNLFIPLVSAMVINAATDGNFNQALIYTALFAFVAIVYVFFHHLNYGAYAKNALFIHDTLQRKILDKIATLDQDYTKKITHAAIVNASYTDVTSCQRIPDYLFDFITEIIGMFIDAMILLFVDPIIGGVTIGLMIFAVAAFIRHMKKRDYYQEIRRTHQDEISNLYAQIIDGYKEVHSFNMHRDLHRILSKENQEWKRLYFRQRIHSDLGQGFIPFLLGVGRIFAYIFAATLILKGEYNVATLVLVVGYYENMIEKYDSVSDIIFQMSKAHNGINRLYKFFNYKPAKKTEFGAYDNDYIRGEINFDDVSFTYGRKPLMRDVSFNIKPCSLTGIVGKSGSGKSTIFRLLLRLYKPTRGKIAIDGKKINEFNKDVYATNVSIVNQKPFVFDMTIRENLSMVDPDPEHQIEACKKVGIHDFIMRQEKGYDTVLLADGGNISAGHKQLLSLARTLLSKSEILLFDEVTSTLNADDTKRIVAILKKLKKDHTVLVITHKPEVMRSMDELLVIDQGRLVGRGTHKNLLHNKYYKLLQK